MAKKFVTTNGVVKIPGAYPSYKVQSQPGGLATSGVLMLVGEADGGQHWSAEADLEDNAFGPDSLAEVVAKYQSGPLVDAFRGAISASNDNDIVGSFTRAILVKTNSGGKASKALTDLDGVGTYATMYDKNWGTKGNLIQMAVASAQSETVPSTGSFTYIPAVGTVNASLRVNGGDSSPVNLTANRQPNDFVTDVDAISGVSASGGVNRNILTVSGTIAIAVVSGNTVTFTRSVPWAVTPTAGDTLILPATAPSGLRNPAGGATDANIGAYVITTATSTVITATKLSDAGRGGATPGAPVTAPAATVAPVAIAAVTDISAWSPVTVNLTAGAVLQGAGKSLEIAELATGTDLLSRTAFVLGTVTPATWVSKASAPALLTSAAESQQTLSAARVDDNISETWTAGGVIPLRVGYTGSNVTLTISDTQLTTSGGSLPLTLKLADYNTIQALANYINAQAGYSASVGTSALGLASPTTLDRVSGIGISSEWGTVQPGRIKNDAWELFEAISDGSQLVQFNNPEARPAAGLPATTATTYLTGGTKGGTSNDAVASALVRLEAVDGNFLVTLFSRNATSDIADGLTDAASTYTASAVNAAAKSHVLAMSQFKRRRNRQALVSLEAAFAAQQEAAANLASFRVNMTFQNIKDLDSNGDIVTFAPWMGAVKAASMQAAGFYRSITNKLVDISGVTHSAGDFSPKSDSALENALDAGLMPIRPARTGGFSWVSDQTTYGEDDNFVFNSLQAVYAADTIALTTGQRMEKAFVGQSVADISAQVALTYLDQIMADFLRLKLIAPSDDAKKGYKNAKIRISGNAMLVSVEIKLATAIDFVIIDFLVSPVQQTA